VAPVFERGSLTLRSAYANNQHVTLMARIHRRDFMTALALVPAVAANGRVFAGALGTRALSFLHLHTGERLTVEYFGAGQYLKDALVSINRLLRDFRTGEVHAIDAGVLDQLHEIALLTGTSKPYQVISGYRSPATNQMLRQHSEGVAASSLHMSGRAIDIRLADVPLPKVRRAALSMRRGGVGYYPKSDFVHIDTGRVRFW
jgi:uncharacterized protein YcbK (DUF882 family)